LLELYSKTEKINKLYALSNSFVNSLDSLYLLDYLKILRAELSDDIRLRYLATVSALLLPFAEYQCEIKAKKFESLILALARDSLKVASRFILEDS
jgi:hypothetical protein